MSEHIRNILIVHGNTRGLQFSSELCRKTIKCQSNVLYAGVAFDLLRLTFIPMQCITLLILCGGCDHVFTGWLDCGCVLLI